MAGENLRTQAEPPTPTLCHTYMRMRIIFIYTYVAGAAQEILQSLVELVRG